MPELVPFNGDMLALPDWLHYVDAMCRSYQRILYVIDAFQHAKGNDMSSWSVRVMMPSFFEIFGLLVLLVVMELYV